MSKLEVRPGVACMLIVHFISYAVVLLAVIAVVLMLVALAKATRAIYHSLRPKTQQERQSAQKNAIGACLSLYLIVVAGVIIVLSSPQRVGGGPAGGENLLWWVILPPLGVTLFVVGLVLVRWLRFRDPDSSRALRRADEGDLDGAIRELREAIEFGGATPVRLNNLGFLLLKREAHAESLEVFREAEKLGGLHAPVFRANQAVVLRKLGRPEEGLPLIEEARMLLPSERVIAWQESLILADLGRFDEAREQLKAAESMPRVWVFPKSAREAHAKLLKECQDRLAVKPVAALGDLEEWT